MIILTQRELAKELKVTVQTIIKWGRRGMPALRGPKAVRYEFEKVIEWLKQEKKV